VKTLSVKSAAIRTASAASMFAPDPMSARAAFVSATQVEAPKTEPRPEFNPEPVRSEARSAESRAEAPLPPPPGARPGVLGVLSSRDVAREIPTEAPVRTVTASIAPIVPAAAAPQPTREPVRQISTKPAPSAAAPARTEIPTAAPTKTRGGWILQVGAFEGVDEAKEKLATARARASSILKDAEAYTEVFNKGDKRFYRARFAGLKESSAEQACKELQKSKMACFAVRN
jgi:D-alanyl-D-alanine carboxypeptidase